MGGNSSREEDLGAGDGAPADDDPRINIDPAARTSSDSSDSEQEDADPEQGVRAAARVPLEPRRHQGGQRDVNLLNVLNYLFRTRQLRVGSDARRLSGRGLVDVRDFPSVNFPLDTTMIDASDFKQGVIAKSGLDSSHKMAYPYGCIPLSTLTEFRALQKCEKAQLFQGYLPNFPRKFLEIEERLFCGLHSQDGNVLMTAGQDQRIRIYDTSKSCDSDGSFRFIRGINARDVGWSVLDVRLSTCGRYVAYSSWSDSIHLATVHDDSTHIPVRLNADYNRANNGTGVFSLMFSHDDSEILCGVNHGDIYVCGVNTGRSQRISAHHDDVNTVAFADATSQILYSGSDDGIIKVWDRRNLSEANPRPCGIFVGHKHGITYLDPHMDGRHILSNSKDQCIKLWDIRRFSPADSLQEAKQIVMKNRWDYRYRHDRDTPTCSRKLQSDTSLMTYTGHIVSQTLIRARFSPYESTASRFIYAGDGDGCVYIFDALTGQQVRRLRAHSAVVRDVSWHPSRPEIVSSGWDGCQLLWTFSHDMDVDDENDADMQEARERVRKQSVTSEESESD